MPSFYVDGKGPYTVGKESKSPVNIPCEAFGNGGWRIFKRKAHETDAAMKTRIEEAIARARKVRACGSRFLA